MSSNKASQLPERVKFTGRILFLTEDYLADPGAMQYEA